MPGHEAVCEAAFLAMKTIYAQDDADAILLLDATNAFNTINRQAYKTLDFSTLPYHVC